MGYSFDGNNDWLQFGTDSSIGNFAQLTLCCWIVPTVVGTGVMALHAKQANNATWFWRLLGTDPADLRFNYGWSTTNLQDSAYGADIVAGQFAFVALTYDRGSTANDAVMYLDGTSLSITRDSATPGVTAKDDTTQTLRFGTDSALGNDYNGLMSAFIYDDTIWSAADINRARWWGTRGGSMKVNVPCLTGGSNKGTGTISFTAQNAVLASLPRIERNWGSMMGVGR